MSDDENFMTDRRGIKRAHESPQKINSLFDGEALDVGDECSVDSDYPDWNEHFKNHPSQQEPEDSEDEATESDDNDFSIETAIKDPNYWDMQLLMRSLNRQEASKWASQTLFGASPWRPTCFSNIRCIEPPLPFPSS